MSEIGTHSRRGLLAAIGAASLGGCTSLASTQAGGVEWDLDVSCHDYETAGGDRRNDCTVYLYVHDLGTATFVEMRVVNGVNGETDLYTVDYDDPVGLVHTASVGRYDLVIGDRVRVTAVYPDASREELEHVELGEVNDHYVTGGEGSD